MSEPYGMPPGTNINYKAVGFPAWVDQLCLQWGLDSSTYAGHQESDRPDIGSAPNPDHLNRGIDWAGDPQRMLNFAHWLCDTAPPRSSGVYGPLGLEMVIYEHAPTGERVWYPSWVNYDSDFSGHRDHVHTRQSASLIDEGTVPPQPPTRPAPQTVMTVPIVGNPDGTWTSPSPAWAHLIMRESSGNPTIIQQITDINSGGNEAEGLFQITPRCVPLDSQIVTKRGILRHDEVVVGDQTIGYNPETGRSEWTDVLEVCHFDAAAIYRVGRGKWYADATINHRWVTLRPQRPESLTACPHCGWSGNPRTGLAATPRSVSTHMGRAHAAKQGVMAWKGRFELIESNRLTHHHSILLAAAANTGRELSISEQEAAIIGWVVSDGHIRRAGNSYSASIWQSKPEQVAHLEELLSDVPHGRSARWTKLSKVGPCHVFRLSQPWVTELVKRADLDISNITGFVLRLSPSQRSAFLDAVVRAEGHTRDGLTRIVQAEGDKQDAIALAVYLAGYHPSFTPCSGVSNLTSSPRPAHQVGMSRPYRTSVAVTPTGRVEPVWCVRTGLGTWTMRQGKRIMLTGNTWRAHNGNEFAPSARSATPQQQAIVAARIFAANPSGSDWGAGLAGREDPGELAAGLVPLTEIVAPSPSVPEEEFMPELSPQEQRNFYNWLSDLHAVWCTDTVASKGRYGDPAVKWLRKDMLQNDDGFLYDLILEHDAALGGQEALGRITAAATRGDQLARNFLTQLSTQPTPPPAGPPPAPQPVPPPSQSDSGSLIGQLEDLKNMIVRLIGGQK